MAGGGPTGDAERREPWSLSFGQAERSSQISQYLFSGIFLLYLLQTAGGVAQYSHGWAAVAGYGILIAFCVCYLASLGVDDRHGSHRQFYAFYGALCALWAAEAVFAHADASVMGVFITVLTVASLGARAFPVAIGFTVIAVFFPLLVPSWHAGVDTESAVSIPMVALAMYGFFSLVRQHHALVAARAEVSRLAADNERNRIARDLHDLLGHSLTTITVKAGLARRLGESDTEGALREITEVEQLSRRALADVRAAVSNYRELTLAGELATAQELLRAAGIVATLPGPNDVGDAAPQELFAWVLREGLTNVVRHARATHCTVTITDDSIEITDDGAGGSCACEEGNGLHGLRERVQAAGGSVEVGPGAAGGWRLRVHVPSRRSHSPRAVLAR
jgi:two-component system sensor histidine kinase DesK